MYTATIRIIDGTQENVNIEDPKYILNLYPTEINFETIDERNNFVMGYQSRVVNSDSFKKNKCACEIMWDIENTFINYIVL